MKNKIFGIATAICLLFLFSCKKDELKSQGDFSWIKIDVPEAHTIYSFIGNVENELVVGGNGALRKTSNRGEVWTLVQDSIIAYELRKSQDTLCNCII